MAPSGIDDFEAADPATLAAGMAEAARLGLPVAVHAESPARLLPPRGDTWRDWARSVYALCELGPHIRAEGWDDWGKDGARERAVYAEIGCGGPGAAGPGRRRVAWARAGIA